MRATALYHVLQALTYLMQLMSLSFFTRRGAGALANQVTVDLGRVEAFQSNIVGSLMISLSLGIGALNYLLRLTPLLTTVTLRGNR